jgi:hypothetical protein
MAARVSVAKVGYGSTAALDEFMNDDTRMHVRHEIATAAFAVVSR